MVSQSHEPSYYEIALTNRQVLVVFVVLLVCIVAAFFSGVWVGQKDTLAAPAPQVATTEGGFETSEPEEDSQEGVGELHFFSEQQEEAEQQESLAQIAEQPKPATTLAEDLGADEASEESADEPTEVAQAEPDPPVEQPVAAKQETTPAPAPTPSTPEVTENAHVVQVFSSSDEAQARKLLKQLSDGGYPAFLSPVAVGGQTMYRVRIGPYNALQEAENVARRVRRSFKLDTWVTR